MYCPLGSIISLRPFCTLYKKWKLLSSFILYRANIKLFLSTQGNICWILSCTKKRHATFSGSLLVILQINDRPVPFQKSFESLTRRNLSIDGWIFLYLKLNDSTWMRFLIFVSFYPLLCVRMKNSKSQITPQFCMNSRRIISRHYLSYFPDRHCWRNILSFLPHVVL